MNFEAALKNIATLRPNSKHISQVVHVTQSNAGIKQCLENALNLCCDNPRLGLTGGWLLFEYDGSGTEKSMMITHHYWTQDILSGIHYDSTPFILNIKYEYIEDRKLLSFVKQCHDFNIPLSYLACSFHLKDDVLVKITNGHDDFDPKLRGYSINTGYGHLGTPMMFQDEIPGTKEQQMLYNTTSEAFDYLEFNPHKTIDDFVRYKKEQA
jgi:hypothetical protein